jgi:SAM-dependent methyltransferase
MSGRFAFGTWEQAVQWLRNQPGQSDLVRACYYDDPLELAAERFANSSEWRAVREYLPTTRGLALDAGAGRGISSYALARDGWRVIAVEPDPSTIVGAGAILHIRKATGFPIEVADELGESLPFESNAFDLVYCRAVLHHARDLSRFCKELGRVLKHGGTLVATREHVVSRSADVISFQRNHPLHRLYGGENAFRLREYLNALKGGGIRITKVLNPLASDINTFPDTVKALQYSLARKARLPLDLRLPAWLLRLRGSMLQTPGRLYSFIGRKA